MNIFVYAPSQKSAAVQREKHSLLTCTGEWVGNWEEDWVVEWSICEKFNDEKIMLYGRDLWPIWKCIGQSIKSFNAKNNFWWKGQDVSCGSGEKWKKYSARNSDEKV